MQCRGNNNRSFNEDDSIKVEKMSIKDSSFLAYLNEKVHNSRTLQGLNTTL
jgi:hypothetical protein